MDLSELHQHARRRAQLYSREYDITVDEVFALLKLHEEVGEFSEAALTWLRKSRPDKWKGEAKAKEALAAELADVVGMAFVNADVFDIDLQKALEEKQWVQRDAE